MRKLIQLAVLAGVLVLVRGNGVSFGDEPTAADGVKSTLAALHAWLDGNTGAPGWKKFLKSDELAAQLAKGDAADRAAIAEILAAYSSSTPGLDKPRFAAVRKSLVAWQAELSAPKVEDLPAAVRAAAAQFTPVDPQRAIKAKAKLAAAAATLDRWLALGGPKSSAGWKTFLAWDELQKLLAAGAEPDAKASETLFAKYRSNEAGLELARFIALREAVREYAQAVENSSEEKLKEEYPKQIEELAMRLEAYAKTGSGEEAAAAGRLAAWLEQAGQARSLVAGIRGNFKHSNLYASVSARLIDAAVSEKVDNVTQIEDVILKTQIFGTAYTRGQISSALAPSTKSAALDIILNGNTYSNNVGYQGPVTIYTDGNTSVHARKRLIIDATGLRSTPAEASCSTASNINDIEARLRIIERIAWRKAGKSQGQAESIASGKAEARVAAQMDERVAELVAKANESFVGRFRNPLLRRGEFPKQLILSTTTSRLAVQALQQNASQLAAPTPPPALNESNDLAMRVHDSLVGNFAEGVMGGETLTDEKLRDLVREATGSVPEELELSPDKDAWSITFPTVQPLAVQFADDTVKIALRGQRFTRGENAIKEPMQISATYKIERTGIGVKFVRQGDVVAEYVKPGKLSVTQVTFKTFMRRKFEALFKPEFNRGEDGLKLPGPRLEQVGTLEVVSMTADKGWLSAAWKMADKARTARVTK